MDVQELTKPVEPEKKQRSGWLVAAGAFALVIVFVGAAMLLTSSTDGLPAATTPPTTEALTPTTAAAVQENATETTMASVAVAAVDPAVVAFLEAYVAELNDGNIDAIESRFEGAVGEGMQVGVEALEATYGTAMDSAWDLVDCKVLTGGLTRCLVARLSEHEPYFPDGSTFSIAMRVSPTGELVTFRPDRLNDGTSTDEQAFAAWMQEINPAEWTNLYMVRAGFAGYHEPRISNPIERSELKKAYVPLWRASLDN